jgi:hypothetical protein
MLSLVLIHMVLGGLIALRFRVFALMPALLASGVLMLVLQGVNGTSVALSIGTIVLTSIAMQAGFAIGVVTQAVRVRDVGQSAGLVGTKRV